MKFNTTFRVSLAALLTQVTSCSLFYAPTYEYKATITSAPESRTIIYDGSLGKYELNRLKNIIEASHRENSSIETLRIRSSGGEVYSSIQFARYLSEVDIDIEVWEYCLSACALYLAPATRTFVPSGSILGFHGSTCNTNLYPFPLKLRDAASVSVLQHELYNRLGINSAYANYSPDGFVEYLENEFWSFNQHQLELMGIFNIHIEDDLAETITIGSAVIRPVDLSEDEFKRKISHPIRCFDYSAWAIDEER